MENITDIPKLVRPSKEIVIDDWSKMVDERLNALIDNQKVIVAHLDAIEKKLVYKI